MCVLYSRHRCAQAAVYIPLKRKPLEKGVTVYVYFGVYIAILFVVAALHST